MKKLTDIKLFEIIPVSEYNYLVPVWKRFKNANFEPRCRGFVLRLQHEFKFFQTIKQANEYKTNLVKKD